MVISTKFNIGEEVYVIYKNGDGIYLFKDKVKEILVSKDKKIYYLENHDCEEWQEDELEKTYLTTNLINKIEELTREENEIK